MGADLFSVPIFLICFREVTEASIILSVLLALVEQIVKHTPAGKTLTDKWTKSDAKEGETSGSEGVGADEAEKAKREKRLLRRLRIQIFAGSFVGLFIAFCIGAAFLAVYYTKLTDLYGNAEELWEGIFAIIAMVMIFIMGLTMLRMDRAKVKWRLKLASAFETEAAESATQPLSGNGRVGWIKSMFSSQPGSKGVNSSKYILFFLPLVTVLREGLEAVVFIGGVSLGQPASSIPIAAIVGIICGLLVGALIYGSSSRLNLSIFLVVSTAFLMLIGAGLLAKAAWYFTLYPFIKEVGGDVAEAGDGPGSYPVDGVIYHLPFGNPENNTDPAGWGIFSGIFGWNNTMTIATLLCYIGYWLVTIACLIYMKWSEGRCTFFGIASQTRKDRLARRAARQDAATDAAQPAEKLSSHGSSGSDAAH